MKNNFVLQNMTFIRVNAKFFFVFFSKLCGEVSDKLTLLKVIFELFFPMQLSELWCKRVGLSSTNHINTVLEFNLVRTHQQQTIACLKCTTQRGYSSVYHG